MDLREAFEKYKLFKIPSFSIICEKASLYSKTCLITIIILFFFFIYLLQQVPHWQVAQFGITNPKDLADAENSYRATLAQILGGIAIGIGLYYTWRRINIAEKDLKITQENLKVFQEGQITERFTRAVDQLGNERMEIRLGGIYALERIANESEKDHWPIMEILTAYIRKNSNIDNKLEENSIAIESTLMDLQDKEIINNEVIEVRKIPLDIQAILTVIGRRNKHFIAKELSSLNLSRTHLVGANLGQSNFYRANLGNSNLEGAFLRLANLNQAVLYKTNLTQARLRHANLVNAILTESNLENADFKGANLQTAYFQGANLKNADFERANLKGANNLTIDQLSKVETLYNAQLDDQFCIPLKKEYPHLFEEPKDER